MSSNVIEILVPGEQGPQGDPGTNGTNGTNGANGLDGTDGVAGINGQSTWLTDYAIPDDGSTTDISLLHDDTIAPQVNDIVVSIADTTVGSMAFISNVLPDKAYSVVSLQVTLKGPQGPQGEIGNNGTNGTTPSLLGGSNTTAAVGIGQKSFTLPTPMTIAFPIGSVVKITENLSHHNYMVGTVVGPSTPTLATINITQIFGTGTFSSWNLTLGAFDGAKGADGAAGEQGPPGPAEAPTGSFTLSDVSASMTATYSGSGFAVLHDFCAGGSDDHLVLDFSDSQPLVPGTIIVFSLEDITPPPGGRCTITFSPFSSDFAFGAGQDFASLVVTGDGTGGSSSAAGCATFVVGYGGLSLIPIALGSYYFLS